MDYTELKQTRFYHFQIVDSKFERLNSNRIESGLVQCTAKKIYKNPYWPCWTYPVETDTRAITAYCHVRLGGRFWTYSRRTGAYTLVAALRVSFTHQPSFLEDTMGAAAQTLARTEIDTTVS